MYSHSLSLVSCSARASAPSFLSVDPDAFRTEAQIGFYSAASGSDRHFHCNGLPRCSYCSVLITFTGHPACSILDPVLGPQHGDVATVFSLLFCTGARHC